MMTNGCLESSNITECSTVSNGLFTNGLQAAIQYYAGLMREMLILRLNTHVTGVRRLSYSYCVLCDE